MTDGSGSSTWAYDSLGQLTSTKNGAGSVVGFAYDSRGNNTTIAYPSGTVTRTFDPAGRMSAVTDWLGNQTTYLYDADGTVWAWGLNSTGQLLDSTTTPRKVPVKTSSQAGVATVAAGGGH
ncbi:MAG: hypothetical protein ACSLFB_04145 [Acidimicrobiales bacterium]